MIRSIIFIIGLVVVGLLSWNDVKSQGPDCYEPYTEIWIEDMIINGCPVIVRLCVHCAVSPNGTQTVDVIIMGYGKNPDCNFEPPLDQNQVLEQIAENLKTKEQYINQLCQDFLFPPCPYISYITLSVPVCWQKTLAIVPNTQDTIMLNFPCDLLPTNCFRQWQICWEDGVLKDTLIYGPELTGWMPMLCDSNDDEPEDPEWGYTSTCFNIATPCYP